MCGFRTRAGCSREFRLGAEQLASAVLVSHMPLPTSLFHLNKCATTLVRHHRVKEVVYKVSLTPTLQRHQQPAQRRASSSARRDPALRRTAAASSCAGALTDWRNGSASDSSPEGYAFESRIGH